jgi:hypothetical protein
MASRGMPKTTQLASSYASVRAPACFIRSNPSAPSAPFPLQRQNLIARHKRVRCRSHNFKIVFGGDSFGESLAHNGGIVND